MKKRTISFCLKDSNTSEISVQEAGHWTFRANQHVLAKGQRRNRCSKLQSLLVIQSAHHASIWRQGHI